MISIELLNLDLPIGDIPETRNERGDSPEENDAWHLENDRLRKERGDFSRSETPVNVMFEIVP